MSGTANRRNLLGIPCQPKRRAIAPVCSLEIGMGTHYQGWAAGIVFRSPEEFRVRGTSQGTSFRNEELGGNLYNSLLSWRPARVSTPAVGNEHRG